MENQLRISEICQGFDNNPKRMIDILWAIQNTLGWISGDSMKLVAEKTNSHRVVVEGVASFYSFFKTSPQGKIIIHLSEDII
ncbi:NAD(P)H-dependent oxidoreductase subunit E, partial [Oleiphilus sp. HI0128]